MYLFFSLLLSLVLSLPALAEEAPLFTFVPEPVAKILEPDLNAAQPDMNTLAQTRRNVRERILDMLGISRLVPHGHFMAFGLQARWALAVPDEESVALRVSARW